MESISALFKNGFIINGSGEIVSKMYTFRVYGLRKKMATIYQYYYQKLHIINNHI